MAFTLFVVLCPALYLFLLLRLFLLPPPSPSSDSRIARAKARGFISRATRCLFQRGLAPLVPSTVESLRKLHPPSSGAPCPILPDSAPRIHVDGVVLSGLVMRKVANGSAPGPSGWTGELIKALVGDADCLAGLVALVEDIINGDLDDSARKYLLSSSLIASEKDSGGFRPIAIGDVFYRLACHYVLQLVQPSAAALLEPIQLAQSRVVVSGPSIFCRRH